jgi:hypothetical protein
MYYSQLEAYIIRLRILENYVLIPHFPQIKKKSVCPNLFEQADFFFICKDAIGRLGVSGELRSKAASESPHLSVQIYLSKQISFYARMPSADLGITQKSPIFRTFPISLLHPFQESSPP